jgi:hypothetical protein
MFPLFAASPEGLTPAHDRTSHHPVRSSRSGARRIPEPELGTAASRGQAYQSASTTRIGRTNTDV